MITNLLRVLAALTLSVLPPASPASAAPDHAGAGELASRFHEPTFQEQFDQAGEQLLIVVGMKLLRSYPPGRAGRSGVPSLARRGTAVWGCPPVSPCRG
ncbi:hypothetical protein ACFXAW_35625 [Streptomyces sp. NPDC059445]|uniref:hypothetical protein n=1 Tax=Streptomyces sp. NPDC059445 TaxID=3346832 RepID=UPI0036C28A12